jgi:hypothetical protein
MDNSPYKKLVRSPQPTEFLLSSSKTNEYCHHKIFSEICSLLSINTYRILIISMILIWSLDITNFLFVTDLLKSSGQSEERSTLLIAITGVADLTGQLCFGYFLIQ